MGYLAPDTGTWNASQAERERLRKENAEANRQGLQNALNQSNQNVQNNSGGGSSGGSSGGATGGPGIYSPGFTGYNYNQQQQPSQQQKQKQQPKPQPQEDPWDNIIDTTPDTPVVPKTTETQPETTAPKTGNQYEPTGGMVLPPSYPEPTPTETPAPTVPEPVVPVEPETSETGAKYYQPRNMPYDPRKREDNNAGVPRTTDSQDTTTPYQEYLESLIDNNDTLDDEWSPDMDNGSALAGTNYGYTPSAEELQAVWNRRFGVSTAENGITPGTVPVYIPPVNETVPVNTPPVREVDEQYGPRYLIETPQTTNINSDMRRPGYDYEPSAEMNGSRYEGGITPMQAQQYYEGFLESLLENPDTTHLNDAHRNAKNNYVEPTQTPMPGVDINALGAAQRAGYLPDPTISTPAVTTPQNTLSYDWTPQDIAADWKAAVTDTNNPYFNNGNTIDKTVEGMKAHDNLVKAGYEEAKKQSGWTERDRRAYAEYYADQKTREAKAQTPSTQTNTGEYSRGSSVPSTRNSGSGSSTSTSTGSSNRPVTTNLEDLIDDYRRPGRDINDGTTPAKNTNGGSNNNLPGMGTPTSGGNAGTYYDTTKLVPSGGTTGNAVPQGSEYYRPSYGQQDTPIVKAPYKTGGYTEAELRAMGNSPYTDIYGYQAYEGYYQAPDKHWYPVNQQRVNNSRYYSRNGSNYNYRGSGSSGGGGQYQTFGDSGPVRYNNNNNNNNNRNTNYSYYGGTPYYSGNNSTVFLNPDQLDQNFYKQNNIMKNWASN